jgi:alpha-galactosidase
MWLALLLFLYQPPADLTGKWVYELETPGGERREMSFGFIAKGGKLEGFLGTAFGEEAISDGKVTGDEVSFTVKMEFGDQARVMEYRGKLVDGQLRLMLPGVQGRPGREIVARRVSTDPPQPAPPLPPPVLPELKELPDNGLARTPPMGWNSWNKFGRGISDLIIREIADALVTSGMRDAGYVYVNIDDAWQGTRDDKGNIRPNEKFPDMKALADYVHSRGLKLGIYSSPGPRTCAGYEGSYNHEEQDARTFAGWGIDYLKYDWCSAGRVMKPEQMRAAYQKMGEALRATGRPIVYSLCQYGQQNVGEWGAKAGGNLWRTTGDIRDTWESMTAIGFDKQFGWDRYAGPGRWNDPDMLEVGNGGMTTNAYRTHFSLWALLAAPLLAGNDVRAMTPETRSILLNLDVIAVNQDPLGKQATRMFKDGDAEVWVKPLADGSEAIGLFNRGSEFREIGTLVPTPARIRDLWTRREIRIIGEELRLDVPPHGVVLIRATPLRGPVPN